MNTFFFFFKDAETDYIQFRSKIEVPRGLRNLKSGNMTSAGEYDLEERYVSVAQTATDVIVGVDVFKDARGTFAVSFIRLFDWYTNTFISSALRLRVLQYWLLCQMNT